MNALEIKNITKNYGDFHLENISFILPCGNIMGLIGENGAGKSTIINCILDTIEKDSGTISILGQTNEKNNLRLKEDIGVVFDVSEFYDNYNILQTENILKDIYKKWDKKTFYNYMEKFDLPKNKLVKDFSRGMKMKLAISIALSHQPKLLILDEATSGLDPIMRDEIFIKAWLRAQYAITIRENKAGAVKLDFDIIGGPFHKWVRDESKKLNLETSYDFEQFIRKFAKYADIYMKIREAESKFSKETKYVYYNAQLNFTFQPQLILSTICFEDSWDIIIKKMNIVARFIDLYIVSRVTNYSKIEYSTIKNYIFNVTKEIRNLNVNELKDKLLFIYNSLDFDSDKVLQDFRLNGFTKKYIKHMLARITGYIEENTGVASNYCNYVKTVKVKNPFEVEHIICDHFEWFTDEYLDHEDFRRWRNSLGALLLLHKSINASLNDAKYEYKLNKYCSNEGNIYSESLGTQAYQNNPQFIKFIKENKLPFEPYQKFGKKEIEKRNELFAKLFKLVWNNEVLKNKE
ncbi:ABC transporter ATP-binding protein [Candidatus Stoquefichus massiliensis]|uniref:ABC transporter ATP-binding protein n=1 Tax=Candidatus Stoquefichus massiliensis TaxID=1470350 RepID=UPI0004B83FF1|nr:ABC transporter ATP-binding protein [Candidatus Stoquefichus massiliensis]